MVGKDKNYMKTRLKIKLMKGIIDKSVTFHMFSMCRRSRIVHIPFHYRLFGGIPTF